MHILKRTMGICPLALAVALTLGGCSMVRHNDASARAADGAPANISFPNPARSTEPGGRFVNLENLRKVSPGMTKAQLYDQLGAPQFNEGVVDVRTWNYIFDFRKADGSGDFFSCQYQVEFDRHGKAQAFYWKPESCKSVLDVAVPATPAPAPAPTPIGAPIRLSADALFGFDSAKLTPEGSEKLSRLLGRVKSASEIQDILVAGYSDRIGSDRYNLALSRRRAESVRDYLVANGVSVGEVHIDGRGKADPVVRCSNRNRAALIACLAPNRRVELSGMARQP